MHVIPIWIFSFLFYLECGVFSPTDSTTLAERQAKMEAKIFSLIVGIFLLLATADTAGAHNITTILAAHPSLSTFNYYLTVTHLAAEINRRRTITVCVVNNDAMAELLDKHYTLPTIRNILSLHIFADYFGAKKLHQVSKGSTTTSSLFQATGEAAGTSGYVNITDMKGGKVGFTPVDSDSAQPLATFVKSVHELPYDLAVIQISRILTSPEAEAPTAGPGDLNVTTIMSKQGCKDFSDLIIAQGVEEIFTQCLQGGLTIFCPSGETLKAFMPKYHNLSSDNKTSLLLYHGVPIYNSLGMLKSSNGLLNTLATEGARKYDFTIQTDGDDVKIETKVVTATITATLIDEYPLAVFKINKVLQPTELFNAAPGPKSATSAFGDDSADGPSSDDDDDGASADSTSDGGVTLLRRRISLALFTSVLVILLFPF